MNFGEYSCRYTNPTYPLIHYLGIYKKKRMIDFNHPLFRIYLGQPLFALSVFERTNDFVIIFVVINSNYLSLFDFSAE